jgi:hypothetical protein
MLNRILKGFIVGGLAGTTGAHIATDFALEKKGGTGGGAGAGSRFSGRAARGGK